MTAWTSVRLVAATEKNASMAWLRASSPLVHTNSSGRVWRVAGSVRLMSGASVRLPITIL